MVAVRVGDESVILKGRIQESGRGRLEQQRRAHRRDVQCMTAMRGQVDWGEWGAWGSMFMVVLLCGVPDLEGEPVAEPLECVAAGVVDGEPGVVGVCAGGDERGRLESLAEECR